MMKKLLILALAAFFCSGAQASQRYLAQDQLQFSDFPPAPEPGSQTDKADLQTLHQWQDTRTAAQCARARSEAYETFDEFFGALKPFVAPLPTDAQDVLARVKWEVQTAVSIIKQRYKRPRPFLRDKTLAPCLDKIGGWAYPSGHAALSRLFADMLGDIEPKRAAEFRARGDEVAQDRVIGGVHHPSDIEAGKRLGDILYQRLKRNPAFQSDMSALRLSLSKP